MPSITLRTINIYTDKVSFCLVWVLLMCASRQVFREKLFSQYFTQILSGVRVNKCALRSEFEANLFPQYSYRKGFSIKSLGREFWCVPLDNHSKKNCSHNIHTERVSLFMVRVLMCALRLILSVNPLILTIFTMKGFLFGVSFDVCLEIAILIKTLPTIFTLIR